MRAIALFLVACLGSGCVGDNCFRANGMGRNSRDCQEYRATHLAPDSPGYSWFEYVWFPILVIAAAGEVGSQVRSDPNYQDGNYAATDYTQPQNQPPPQPSYMQQQWNNGNGYGRYGNYPSYPR